MQLIPGAVSDRVLDVLSDAAMVLSVQSQLDSDRQDELDDDELQEIQSAVDTYFDLNDTKAQLESKGYDWANFAGIQCEATVMGNAKRKG